MLAHAGMKNIVTTFHNNLQGRSVFTIGNSGRGRAIKPKKHLKCLESALHGSTGETTRYLFPSPFKLECCTVIWKTYDMAYTLPFSPMCRFCSTGLEAIMLCKTSIQIRRDSHIRLLRTAIGGCQEIALPHL